MSSSCGHDHCGACCGGSCGGGCGGCGSGALYLTEGEVALLRRFAQMPFLPVARRWDAETPVCLEATETTAQSITGLQQKGLIRVDYDLPLSGFDYADYGDYPAHGSMALTARGQQAVDVLEIYGIED